MPRKGWVVAAMCIALAATAPCSGQLPPGLPVPPINFATLHSYGSAGIVDMRHMALGGAHVADDRDGWHGNPAGMIAVTVPAAEVQGMCAPHSKIPEIDRFAVGTAIPLGKRDAIKLLGTWVDAHGAVAGFAAPVHVDAVERDFSIEYAHRINSRLVVGAATAYLGTQSDYQVPGLGSVTQFSSRPCAIGGRLGAIYRVLPKVSVGFTYDNYQEVVDQYAPAFMLTPKSDTFHTTGWHYGVAYWPDPLTAVLLDYQDLHVLGAGDFTLRRNVMGGVERRVGNLFLRVGTFQGNMTGGVGARVGNWDLSYAFSGKDAKDIPDRGAHTSHSVLLRHYF